MALSKETVSKLNNAKKPPEPEGALWRGPEVDGITQSLLGSFLECRERFRVRVIEGLRPADSFNARLEYGNMWHVCEEALAQKKGERFILDSLLTYCQKLVQTYPMQQVEIDKWYNCCKVQFPIYIRYWEKNEDVVERKPLMQEEKFTISYHLPSGRKVLLRGKFDSVDLIGKEIWLQENKTKSEIDEIDLQRQLTFDLQSMFYLVALSEKKENDFWNRSNKAWRNLPVAGVRYNVIRRPLSGGKGTIRKHQPTKKNPTGETDAEYYERLRTILAECPNEYFTRFKVEVHRVELQRFQRECFNPLLEQLCFWYDWITSEAGKKNPFDNPLHFRRPYGLYSVVDEMGWSEVDNYIATGNKVGLVRASTLFPELEV